MKFWSLAILIGAAAYGISEAANARSMTLRYGAAVPEARMSAHGLTGAPIGYVNFCRDYPSECRSRRKGPSEVRLTGPRQKELQSVNEAINLAIKPISDEFQYGRVEHWTYPTTGKGDCEDYVLLKKRKLIALGWPANALLITVVRDENNEGHAVLTVRTDHGDLILDNKHSRILGWRNTPYTYIKRQSASSPLAWESLIPRQTEPTVSASGADARE